MSEFLDQISDQLNLRWAWEKVKREGSPGDVWLDEVELAGFELDLEKSLCVVGNELRKGRYRLAPLRPIPFPKSPDKDGKPRVRQAFQVTVKDQVAWAAVVNVVGPHVDSKMPAWSYGNRLYRSIWVSEEQDGAKRRRIGNYRHASGRLYLPFAQSWPIFRRHVYLTTRAMTSATNGPPADQRTEEELQFQRYLSEEHRCPFVYPEYWSTRRPEGRDLPLYWCGIDLERFYATLELGRVCDNIVGALPSSWQPDARRLIESMLHFPLNTSQWDAAELKQMDLRETRRRFRHIPTGLYVAGFLANAALLEVDACVASRLAERPVAHFRFVDDHVMLAYSLDALVQWVDEYTALLENAATGARINAAKIQPAALGEWFRKRARKPDTASMGRMKAAASRACKLDPKFPSPLMTKTLALVSGIARMDFDLLDTAELTNLSEQLEQLLLVDLPEEEIPEKTRLAFAASRLSRVAECRLANNDQAAHLNGCREALKAELDCVPVTDLRRQDIRRELATVTESIERERVSVTREVERAFQLLRKVLRERPDRVRLWTRAIVMCRLTGCKGLADIFKDIDGESERNPLAGEYLRANAIALLGGQTLLAGLTLRDPNVARWRREAARAFVEDVRDTPLRPTSGRYARWFLQISWEQYCCGLYCASLVLGGHSEVSALSSDNLFSKRPLRLGQEFMRKGGSTNAPEAQAWWATRKTLRNLSAVPDAFVMKLGRRLRQSEAAFAFWRYFPSHAPIRVLEGMATQARAKGYANAAMGGWWIDALRDRPGQVETIRVRTRSSEVLRACRFVKAMRGDTVTLYEWCRFLRELDGQRGTDPRGGEWTALEVAAQIAALIQQEPVFGESYVRRAGRRADDLRTVHPANFRLPTDWIERDQPTWEEWRSSTVRRADGAGRTRYSRTAERVADSRYTPVNHAGSILFQSVNPVRGLGLILYGLLRRDFTLPSMWNGPGHADVLGMLLPVLLREMTCSSWTMGVLQGCLSARVTENQLLLANASSGHVDDDTLRDPVGFISAAEVRTALRKCQEVLERYQISTLDHRARQLIPVSIQQLTSPEWRKVFPAEDGLEEQP